MEYKAYKLSYYLNAQHSFDYLKSNIHSHTFHLSLYLADLEQQGFINFNIVDGTIDQYIGQYKGKYMNEIAPFDQLLPTIENIGSIFYEELKTILTKLDYDLIQLDISENPVRIYSISDRLYLGSIKGDER